VIGRLLKIYMARLAIRRMGSCLLPVIIVIAAVLILIVYAA
jgi:hypothetical protein